MTAVRAVDIVPSAPDALFGVCEVEQSAARVRGRMHTGPHLAGPSGHMAVGALGVLVDNVLGYALMASLPVSAWSISTEIWLDVVAPLPGDGVDLVAEATAVVPGAFSVGRVCDAEDRPLAECRQRGRQSIDGPRSGAPETIAAPSPNDGGLGELIGLHATDETHLLQMTRELANPRMMLHGGVSLAASELAASRSRAQHGCDLPTTSVHIVHTRGVPVGATVEFRTRTVHAGRTLWLTDVLGTVDDKVCTATRVTAQR